MEHAYTTRFDEAVAFAVDSFRDVFRKATGIPYISHLFSVTALVAEYNGDEDQMIAAMLHDWLEDIDGATPDALRARFGDRVTDLVIALTDSNEQPKPPWRERKERYLAHLHHASPDVKLISAADKLHNCRMIRRDLAMHGPRVFQWFRGEQVGTLWYYRSVVTALEDGWTHPILVALHHEVEGLHQDAASPA